jgi:hypothetical protein
MPAWPLPSAQGFELSADRLPLRAQIAVVSQSADIFRSASAADLLPQRARFCTGPTPCVERSGWREFVH